MTEQHKCRGQITEKCIEQGKKYLKENKEMSEEDKEKIKRMLENSDSQHVPRGITTQSRKKHRTNSKNLRKIKKLRS